MRALQAHRFARIAAVLVALMVFGLGSGWAGSAGTAVIPGLTDNRGNLFVIDKFMTTKFPLSIFLMEMAVQLDELNCILNLQWIPREQNIEADALTNACFESFSAEHRVHINSLASLPWKVAPELFERAQQLDSEIRLQKEARKSGKEPPQPAGKRQAVADSLRYKQPW